METKCCARYLTKRKIHGNAILGKTFKPDVLSKRRLKNTGQAPMYYAENTHPAIIEQEIFDMAQAEMQRRKDEKEASVGTSRYTSKHPLSGLLICGICGHRLRRHVRTTGGGKRVAAWGCTNRIANGRSACDSHHINEDVLEATIRKAFERADTEAIDAVIEVSGEVLGDGHAQELNTVQQAIVDIQAAVLALHKSQQQGTISDTDYDIKLVSFDQQMDTLQLRLKELKESANRYAEVKYWLDTYKAHIQSGESTNTDDAVMLRSLVEKIIVYDEYMEIHLRCGATITEKYVE